MAVPVKLKDIVDELSFQSDEASSHLNTVTGEVVCITDEAFRAAEEEEPLDQLYRDEALRDMAIGWCEEHGIPYTE